MGARWDALGFGRADLKHRGTTNPNAPTNAADAANATEGGTALIEGGLSQ